MQISEICTCVYPFNFFMPVINNLKWNVASLSSLLTFWVWTPLKLAILTFKSAGIDSLLETCLCCSFFLCFLLCTRWLIFIYSYQHRSSWPALHVLSQAHFRFTFLYSFYDPFFCCHSSFCSTFCFFLTFIIQTCNILLVLGTLSLRVVYFNIKKVADGSLPTSGSPLALSLSATIGSLSSTFNEL